MNRSTDADPKEHGPIPEIPSSVSISTNAACRASFSPAPERTRWRSGIGQCTRCVVRRVIFMAPRGPRQASWPSRAQPIRVQIFWTVDRRKGVEGGCRDRLGGPRRRGDRRGGRGRRGDRTPAGGGGGGGGPPPPPRPRAGGGPPRHGGAGGG